MIPDGSRLLQWCPDSLRVQIELTTDCNLRCIYCALSDPGYTPATMSDDVFAKIVSMCSEAKVQVVNVSGHGESTNLPDWKQKVNLLLSHGFKLQISTNAATPWSWEEADLMSRFVHLMISVDTADSNLLRQLRRKVDLRTITHNITLVRAAALSDGRPLPRLALTGVLSDQSVCNLDRLVAMAKALDCEVNLSNLIELHGVVENPPRSLFSLSGAALAEAHGHYKKASELAARLKVPFNVHPNLKEFLETAFANNFRTTIAFRDWGKHYAGCSTSKYRAVSDALKLGASRNCLDPWNMLYFAVDGAIHQCCLSHLDPIANVKDVGTIDAIFASERSIKYRTGLLTGKPVEPCVTCIGRARCTVDEINVRVAEATALNGDGRNCP